MRGKELTIPAHTLPPGDYVFEVECSRNNRKCSAHANYMIINRAVPSCEIVTTETTINAEKGLYLMGKRSLEINLTIVYLPLMFSAFCRGDPGIRAWWEIDSSEPGYAPLNLKTAKSRAAKKVHFRSKTGAGPVPLVVTSGLKSGVTYKCVLNAMYTSVGAVGKKALEITTRERKFRTSGRSIEVSKITHEILFSWLSLTFHYLDHL